MPNSFSQLTPNAVALSPNGDGDTTSVLGFNFMEQEIWKFIGVKNNPFEVSNLGNVRSYKMIGCIHRQSETPKKINPTMDGRGYLNISVRIEGKATVLSLHRLVAKLFIPNPDNLPIVRHLNDIKTDNRVSNLAWGTFKDNRLDGIKNGKFYHEKGQRPSRAKLSKEQVALIFKDTDSNCAIGRKYGVTESTISKIKLGRGWTKVTGLPYIK